MNVCDAQDIVLIEVQEIIGFGKPKIPVSYEFLGNKEPNAMSRISIMKTEVLETNDDPNFGYDAELWSNVCGSQKSYAENGLKVGFEKCSLPKQGTVEFTHLDPADHESQSKFPLNPGLYTACLTDEIGGTNIWACKKFKIKNLPKWVAEVSSVTSLKKTYTAGESIDVQFKAAKQFVNTWIGIYHASEITEGMKELPGEPMRWLYIGCNNRKGDQEESNNCSKLTKSGTVNFTSFSSAEKVKDEEDNRYVACMSFMNNAPYNRFKCSAEFVINQPPPAPQPDTRKQF